MVLVIVEYVASKADKKFTADDLEAMSMFNRLTSKSV